MKISVLYVSCIERQSGHHFAINNIHLYTQQRHITRTKTTEKSVTRIDGGFWLSLTAEQGTDTATRPGLRQFSGSESGAQTWNTSTVSPDGRCFRQATRVKFKVWLQRLDFILLTEVKPIIGRLIRMLLVAVRPGAAAVSPPRPARPLTAVLLTIAGRPPRLPPRVAAYIDTLSADNSNLASAVPCDTMFLSIGS